MNMVHKGKVIVYDYCPECGIKIYKEDNGMYRCHLHNRFIRDYVTGELKPKEDERREKRG